MHGWSKCTLALAAAVWLGGCASGQSAEGAAATPDPVPCLGRDGSPALAGWQQVTTSRFTFCIPFEWRDVGGRSWRGEEGKVTWVPGSPSSQKVPFSVGRVNEPGTRPSGSATSAISTLGPGTVEMVDGVRVTVSVDREGMAHRVRASFSDRDLILEGEGRSLADEAILREIYRSVRFIGKP